jgi:hypothetical protein
MKKLLLLLPLILVISCTVQKRRYQGGFYVDWRSKNSASEKTNNASPKTKTSLADRQTAKVPALEEEIVLNSGEINDIHAGADQKQTALKFKRKKSFLFDGTDSCDVLIFKDGSEVKAMVKEVGLNEIKYKKCENPDGPTYISRKSELFMIKYANGTREVIKSEAPPSPQVQRPTQSYNTYNNNPRSYRKENHPLALASLVLSVLGIIFMYVALLFLLQGFGIAIFALPFLASLAAVITGKTSIQRIKEQPDVYKGKGMAIPGLIMGWIILAISGTILFFALIFSL